MLQYLFIKITFYMCECTYSSVSWRDQLFMCSYVHFLEATEFLFEKSFLIRSFKIATHYIRSKAAHPLFPSLKKKKKDIVSQLNSICSAKLGSVKVFVCQESCSKSELGGIYLLSAVSVGFM